MQFYVEGYSASHGIPEQKMDIYPHIKLVTDDFDDYGNQTLFRMYFKLNKTKDYVFIGKVKILNSENYVVRDVIEYSFEKIGNKFCSLGQSDDYYRTMRKLNQNLKDLGMDILISLNDVAINKDIAEKFPDNSGVFNSLMRDSEAYHAYKMGHNIFYGIGSHIKDEVTFTYNYDLKNERKVIFNFNDDSDLPNRINVIVGKNGTGKTKMLSSLASILSGYNKNEEDLLRVDNRPDFSRYIAVSYSAFDNFDKPFGKKYVKKDIVNEKNYIINEIVKQKNKCAEKKNKDNDYMVLYNFFNAILEKEKDFESENEFDTFFDKILYGVEYNERSDIGSYVYCGLLHENRLITEDEMLKEFKRNFSEIIRMSRRIEWVRIMKNIFDDINDLKRVFEKGKLNVLNIIDNNFRELSSGQKIMVHIFTQLLVSITEDSLLLVDEPEVHLHPNAISNFMRMLNKLLKKFNSFAIISTHSPMVLQEVPAKYVHVLDKNEFYDVNLYNECFGDNISRIVSDVFNVRSDESNYKSYFVQKKSEGLSKDDINLLFNHNLSINAEMYLNLLYKDEK